MEKHVHTHNDVACPHKKCTMLCAHMLCVHMHEGIEFLGSSTYAGGACEKRNENTTGGKVWWTKNPTQQAYLSSQKNPKQKNKTKP